MNLTRPMFLYPSFNQHGAPQGRALQAPTGLPVRLIQSHTAGRGRNKLVRHFIVTDATPDSGWGDLSGAKLYGWVDTPDIAP